MLPGSSGVGECMMVSCSVPRIVFRSHYTRSLLAGEGRADEAQAMSQRLTGLIQEMFLLVGNLPVGNPFAMPAKPWTILWLTLQG